MFRYNAAGDCVVVVVVVVGWCVEWNQGKQVVF